MKIDQRFAVRSDGRRPMLRCVECGDSWLYPGTELLTRLLRDANGHRCRKDLANKNQETLDIPGLVV